ncbi:mCG145213, partial [Mus musculus]
AFLLLHKGMSTGSIRGCHVTSSPCSCLRSFWAIVDCILKLKDASTSRTDVNECFWSRQAIEGGRRRLEIEIPQHPGTTQDEVGETVANRSLYFLRPARDRLLRKQKEHI